MAFLSTTARQQITSNTSSAANYLQVSKIDGSVRIRILDKQPLEYWEVWGYDPSGEQKDHPFRFNEEPTLEEITLALGDYQAREGRNPGLPDRRFCLAFTVWNYDMERIQICAVTQKTLIRRLDEISQMEDYEILSDHDLELSRKGEGIKTEYGLTPLPRRKTMDTKISAAYLQLIEAGYDINRMITGENPFPASDVLAA